MEWVSLIYWHFLHSLTNAFFIVVVVFNELLHILNHFSS